MPSGIAKPGTRVTIQMRVVDQRAGAAMRKFDNEEDRSKELRKNLREQFDFVEKLYDYAAGVEMTSYYESRQVTDGIAKATGTLFAQATKLYRTVYEECSRAEGFCSRLAIRSLYETAMAMSFIHKPEILLRAALVKPGSDGKPKVDASGRTKYFAKPIGKAEEQPGDALSREFRANLYLAQRYFQADEHAKKCETTPILRQFAPQTRANVDNAGIQHFERLLGQPWSYICRKDGYSGLSVAELAELLNPVLLLWYHMIYSLDSSITHGGAALLHLTEDGRELRILSTDRWIFTNLATASLLFLSVMIDMQNGINFGDEHDKQLEALAAEKAAIFKPDRLKT